MKKAKSGNAEAQFEVGINYTDGGIFRADRRRSRVWLEQALSNGYLPAGSQLAFMDIHTKNGNSKRAIRLLRELAEKGDATAIGSLGSCYLYGWGVRKKSTVGVSLLRRAFKRGFRSAAEDLAYAAQHGIGQKRNPQEAARWTRILARGGDPVACATLATMYENGDGVPRSRRLAFRWMKFAAEMGNRVAQQSLGWYYEKGIGTSVNEGAALQWYKRDALAGDAESAFHVALILWRHRRRKSAFEWFREAASNGHMVASDFLNAKDPEILRKYESLPTVERGPKSRRSRRRRASA